MPCDHLGPPELIELAERELRARGMPEDHWTGVRYRHGENLASGMWASVLMEIERRGTQWVVTKLDRNHEPLPESAIGLQAFGSD